MRKFLGLLAAVALLFIGQDALAQAFPSKLIRIIVPFPPGGGIDLVARLLGQKLSEGVRQPVVVENRVGASGAIGSEMVAKSAPDGYTLLMAATTTHGINPALNPKLPYDPVKDFTPVSLVATVPYVLIVNPSVPANSLQQFVEVARSKPGMAFGSAGYGSTHHLVGEMIKSAARISMLHVPYKGTGPAMADIVSGQLQFMSVDLTAAEPYFKAGKVRALAVTSAKRVPGLDLPTVEESGFPGFDVTTWYGIFGPAGLPDEIVSPLNIEIVKALATTTVRDQLQKLGVTAVGSPAADLAAHVRAQLAMWTRVIKAAGIKAE